MGLKGDLLKVGTSNLIVLMSSIVNSFVLPLILTMKGYADYKTYLLYATFIGFLHFGFVDGINVKYGGLNRNNLDYKEFINYHKFFILFQVVIVVLLLIINIFIGNIFVYFICLAILPVNIQSFFLFFYQAIGEFKTYFLYTAIVPIFNITATLVLLLLNLINFEFFIIANICGYYLSAVFLEINLFRSLKREPGKDLNWNFLSVRRSLMVFITGLNNYKHIFKSGFFIMLGTILFNLFFDTGRWISKIFTNDEKFAIYSLSISLIGFVIIFVSAVNKTFYPFLHKNNNYEVITKLRRILLISSTLSFPAFFILKLAIHSFLENYVTALPVTAILITSIPGVFIIKSIYANLYKVEKKEIKFFQDTIVYLILGLILNIALFNYFRTLSSIAIASVISIYVWTLFPMTFKIITSRQRLQEFIYLSFILSGFYLITYSKILFPLNFFLSVIFTVGINLMFYKDIIIAIVKRRA